MKRLILTIMFVLLCLPTLTFGSGCSSSGTSIVYVNGIETTQKDADNDMQSLRELLINTGDAQGINFLVGYNPSHLVGVGDILESITQAFDTPISDFDLNTILDQIASEVSTQKVLLVGHSQGTFYTNEIYDYLVRSGVSPASIAVYNLATPADHVGGGGIYLTSANDKAINYVREMEAEGSAPQALPANIIIPEEPGYADNAWGGHYPSVYFGGAPARIASDIKSELAKLSSVGAAQLGTCFAAPSLGLTYDVQKTVFAAADPAASGIEYAATDARNTVASVMNNANDILHTAFSDVVFSIIPKPTAQNAASAFAVEKALYGSSLSEQDYEALLGGQDVPEVDTPAPSSPQARQAPPTPVPQPQPSQSEVPEPTASPTMPIPTPVPISPGFGGGSPYAVGKAEVPVVPTTSSASTSAQTEQQQTSSTTEAEDGTQTTATTTTSTSSGQAATTTLPFSFVSPQSGESFSTSTVTFSGTTSPGVGVVASIATSTASTTSGQADSTTSDVSGNWSFSLVLPEGTSTIFASAFDTSGDLSPTSTLSVSVELPVTVTTSTATSSQTSSLVEVPPQNPCGSAALSAAGYFFSGAKDDAEYSSDGFLEYHFEDLPQYSDGRPFKLTWQFFDDQCSASGPQTEPKLTITLPSKVTDWSARFTSLTHIDIWDDANNDIVTSYDIPVHLPGYSSSAFDASIDGNASTLVSRGLQIFKNGEVPSFSGSLAAPQGCPAGSASGYFFDSYEHAEYVGGLLRVHLRLRSPYNDGRLFLAGVESEETCSFTYPALTGIQQTSLTPYIRYFSFRMTSPTHWVLWDDENDAQLSCTSECEGDIPVTGGFVSFYASVDGGASTLRTGAYPPTGG